MKTTPAATTLLISFLLITAGQGAAQETQTLFNGDVAYGGFGGPIISFSDIGGELGIWVGGRGGWIINLDPNNAVSLGGGGFGLVTEHEPPRLPEDGLPERDYFALNGYGGFAFEYTNRSYKLIHPTISALIGGGGLMIRDRDFDDIDRTPDQYLVFEPGAELEMNLTHFLRIAAGISYRLTSGISRAGFSDSDFSGFNGLLTLKLGSFL